MPPDRSSIEYRVLHTDRHRGPGAGTVLNEAAQDGWRYVDTIAVSKYDSGTDYTFLMERPADVATSRDDEQWGLVIEEPGTGSQAVPDFSKAKASDG